MKTDRLPTIVWRIIELSVPALIAFAVSWGVYTAKSSAQGLKIIELEKKYESVLELKGDIRVIKNDLGYVKEDMKEIKSVLKELK